MLFPPSYEHISTNVLAVLISVDKEFSKFSDVRFYDECSKQEYILRKVSILTFDKNKIFTETF